MNFLRVRRGGFTLVELLVVIAIITVLIAIGLPVMSRVREKTKQAACIANLQQLQMALRLYRLDEGGYPGPYDPVTGQGGLNALYPTHVSSRKLFICPDDPIEDGRMYATATAFQIEGQYPADPYATLLFMADQMYDTRPGPADIMGNKTVYRGFPWTIWDKSQRQAPVLNENTKAFFDQNYSSYNLLYNWIGYIWWDPDPTLPVKAAKLGDPARYATDKFYVTQNQGVNHRVFWADNVAFWYKWFFWDPENLLDETKATTREWVNDFLPYYLTQQVYWQYYDKTDVRIYPRDKSNGAVYPLTDSLKRPLWDQVTPEQGVETTQPTDYGLPSGVFPGLINHNAPENTIITRCPYHRPFSKNADIVLRLDGTTEIIPGPPYREYNWAVQSKLAP